MLANGMVMIWVSVLWVAVAIISTVTSLAVLTLALVRRPEERPLRVVLISLAVSFAPFLVLLVYAGPMYTYGSDFARVAIPLWLLPVLLSGIEVWLARR
jgi:hypothetical protein